MNKEQVTFKIAKLLKEKGFDCDCKGYDAVTGVTTIHNWKSVDGLTPCCTHQLAMKWLREVHGLFAQIGYYEDWADDADGKKVDSWNYWGIDIFYLPSGLRVDPEITDQYDTYEEAVEAAIKYSLENLI